MAIPQTREQLKNWCLRELGEPVIKVDVPEIQLNDRIDEAIDIFKKYHLDGTQETYLKHQVTASVLRLDAPFSTGPNRGEKISGLASGATATVWKYENGEEIEVYAIKGSFSDGEEISLASGETGFLAADDAVSLGDIDREYVEVSEKILSVRSILPPGTFSNGLFDIRYHIGIEAMQSALNADLIGYKLMRQHVSLIDQLFNQAPVIHFNRLMNRIYIDWNWKREITPDQYLVFKVLLPVDETAFSEFYGDEWLRKLLKQLIKRQWGENLKKFSNVPMPGGAQLNGQEIYNEAVQDLERIIEEMEKRFQRPPGFFVG